LESRFIEGAKDAKQASGEGRPFTYSLRSVRIGSIRPARRAGM
jgi:hypothetical protein